MTINFFYKRINSYKGYSIKIHLLLVINLMVANLCFSQKIQVGNKVSIHSKVLNEEREVWVHLPQSYNDTTTKPAHYPVMYLLDGDWQFYYPIAAQEALSGGMYNYMPEMIVVGITNTDRSRDLTPTNGFMMHTGQKIHTTSGGADQFLQFIHQELKPYIKDQYRTSGYCMLTGHSFGGLCTLYAMLSQPKMFNAYIVIDPSIWWDNKYVYQMAIDNWENMDLKGTTLYMAMANIDPFEEDKLGHSTCIQNFCNQFLTKPNSNGLRSKWAFFENEDHGTISLPAIYSGLKYVFEGYCVPVKKVGDHPEIVQQHFKQVSNSIGFDMYPPEIWLNKVIRYCKKVKKDDAVKILELYKATLY